jgi:thiol-disulfide isomerase/thioredoxin
MSDNGGMKAPNVASQMSSTVTVGRRLAAAGIAAAALLLSFPSRGTADESSTVPPNASLKRLLQAGDWINGRPTTANLAGKVVVVDVFTFDCYNCKNITPNLRALVRSGRPDLVVIGIHTPETSYERDRAQVVSHLASLGVTWPVAVDADYALWKAYGVQYWPTQMIFDRGGHLRKVVIGDSQDADVNAEVTSLLREHG